MSDIYSKEKRSEIMSKIKGKDTRIEEDVRRFLFSQGFRFRKNDKRYPGTPDIVLPKYKTMIFVHGCFWHGHVGCNSSKLPQTRKEFWQKKIGDNKVRDKRNQDMLINENWKVIIIWECEMKNSNLKNKSFGRLKTEILNQ